MKSPRYDINQYSYWDNFEQYSLNINFVFNSPINCIFISRGGAQRDTQVCQLRSVIL